MLDATRHQRREVSSRPSMAPSVYESINRTRIQTSVNYNFLLVYRNQPKLYRTAMIHVFLKQQSSTDLHADVHNSGKLNASAKFRASHNRARFTLPAGTAN